MDQPAPKPVDWLRCRVPDGHFRIQPGVLYQVLEVFEDGIGCPLVGLNVWPGVLWGTWRFESADTNQK